MIEANNLRLGNHVFDDENVVVKVEAIVSDKFMVWNNGNTNSPVLFSKPERKFSIYESSINPIPLNSDIVSRLGFSGDNYGVGILGKSYFDGTYYTLFSIVEPYTLYDDQDFYVLDMRYTHLKMRYVHELQNIYFIIAKQEISLF